MAPNDIVNVSTARGIVGGYLFSAPRTSAVLSAIASLSDMTAPLPPAFENLGYVASDGITESESASTRTDTDMDGRPIGTTRFDRTETVRVRLVESRKESVSERHGHANVEVADGVAIVHHNNLPREHRVYVAELVLDSGRRWRKVIPDGQVTEVGDLALSSTELVGREIAIGCNAHTWELGGPTHTDTVIDFLELGAVDGDDAGGGNEGGGGGDDAGDGGDAGADGNNTGGGGEGEGGEGTTPASGSGTALLASLLTSVPLDPPFDPDITSYTVVTTASALVIRAAPADPAATMRYVRYGGSIYALTGGIDRDQTLSIGTNKLCVEVTNPVTGRTESYVMMVTRAEAEAGDATLSALVLSGGALTPMFDPSISGYAATVAAAAYNSAHIVTTCEDSAVTYRLNGGQWQSMHYDWVGTAWAEGANTLEVRVENGQNAVTYTVDVTYAT